jgi:hypothetical protein
MMRLTLSVRLLRPVTTLASVLMIAALYASAPAAAAASSAGEAATGDWRATVKNFAAEHFKQPAWGYSHCLRDYRLARELAAKDHVALDDDVLYAAAFLHDMAAFPPWAKPPPADHADVAAELVGTVLKDSGFPMSKLERVQGAIRTHMFEREPKGPEALYLHDADALDWLGAIGVARIMALVDPGGGKPQGPDVVPMLEKNLEEVPARVLSPAGRALVPERTTELASFLTNLRRETADLAEL